MNYPVGSEPYDPEKGPDHVENAVPVDMKSSSAEKRWRFIPNLFTIQVSPYEIDRRALQRKLRSKYILIFFLIISIILSSIAIGGCSDSGSQSIYLLQVKYDAYQLDQLSGDGVTNEAAYATMNSNANGTSLAVRIGYFGTCVSIDSSSSNSTLKEWFCDKNVTHITNRLTKPITQDPFNSIYIMNELRSNIMSPVIFIMGVCFTFLSMLVLLAANINQPTLFFTATALTLFSCFLVLVAMVWQQVSVNSTKSVLINLSNNAMLATAGAVPAGLGWTSVFLLFGISIGIVALVVNEKQALMGLDEFGSDYVKNQEKYGQNPIDGRSTEVLPAMKPALGDYGTPHPDKVYTKTHGKYQETSIPSPY